MPVNYKVNYVHSAAKRMSSFIRWLAVNRMINNKIILLKILELLVIGVYMVSFQWVTFMYILGGLYQPVIALGIRDYVGFEWFVIGVTALTIGLLIYKVKRQQTGLLILQNLLIIILGVPLFIFIMLVLNIEVNYQHNYTLPNILVFALTFLTVSYNDWKKSRMSAANKIYSA